MARQASSGAGRKPGEGGGRILSKSPLYTGKFLQLTQAEYELEGEGKQRKWEMVERTTKRSQASADAVTICCKTFGQGKSPKVVVVYQFRPAVGRMTVELPAGLIDEGETAEEAGLRELKEETGLTASGKGVTGNQLLSPGLSNESIVTLFAECNLDSEENENQVQALEDGERISVGFLPANALAESLRGAPFLNHSRLY